MSTVRTAWGMEIGAQAIKAMRLERDGKMIRVTDFAHIPHKKVLTTPDVDQDELVRLSLGQFISQKSLEGEHLVMSVPGHAAFARFAKLPPVEPKKVPDIVKFEAVQQIPFPIEQVEWDYQTFVTEDSPEVEVGIFAITRDRVQQRLGLYSELGISPEALTLSPVAVYNAMRYDHGLEDHAGPLIFLDIGTSATDVIVVEEGRCWIRTFPLGGTHFTEAIASAFKLSYGKAEKLKREAATSKYAKQIMQAMRPVFSDLLQDLQRSIGYYQTAHSDQELSTMVGVGSTFKIPGLRKFLGQQLQLNVIRLDEYKKIQVTGREAAAFAENAVNMATAYGLALQGVGLAEIDANLVPVKALRDQLWHAKTKWFGAAAAVVILGSAMLMWRPITDERALTAGGPPQDVDEVLDIGRKMRDEFKTAQSSSDIGFTAVNMERLLEQRTIWPHLIHDTTAAIASTDPQDDLLGVDPEKIRSIPAEQRRFVALERLGGIYVPPPEANKPRQIEVTMDLELSHENPIQFLNTTVARWLRDNAEPTGERADAPYRIVADSISLNPEKLTTVEVTVDGEKVTGPKGRSSRPSRPAAPAAGGAPAGGGPNARPPRKTGGGFGAGPAGGRRKPTGTRRTTPGTGVGAAPGAAPGARPAGPVTGGFGTQRPGTGPADPTPGGTRSDPAAGAAQTAVESLAPLDSSPKLYEVGSRYYRIPVTFKVEILDEKAAPADPSTARAAGGEVTS